MKAKKLELDQLNEIKGYIFLASENQIRHDAVQFYGLRLSDYDSLMEIREAMLAIEERNYFK